MKKIIICPNTEKGKNMQIIQKFIKIFIKYSLKEPISVYYAYKLLNILQEKVNQNNIFNISKLSMKIRKKLKKRVVII